MANGGRTFWEFMSKILLFLAIYLTVSVDVIENVDQIEERSSQLLRNLSSCEKKA